MKKKHLRNNAKNTKEEEITDSYNSGQEGREAKDHIVSIVLDQKQKYIWKCLNNQVEQGLMLAKSS